MKNIKVGIIGSGRHGSRYAAHIKNDVAGLELGAVCRRAESVFDQGRQWGCRAYRDWRELVADPQVEALITVVPPSLNLEIAEAAAGCAKPLLMEKPLAASVADGRTVVSICKKNALPLTVGQTLRYNQVVERMRKELPGLGQLYSFSANQRLEPSSLAWHEDPALAGAGVSFHTAVHVIDAVSFITGLKVKRLMALAKKRHNANLEDLLTVMVEMEDGVIGTLDCSKVGDARSGRFEFVSRQGQLLGEQIHNRLVIIRGMQRTEIDPGSPVSTIVPLLNQWRDYLSGNGPNPVSGEDGLAAVRFCEACLQSSASGSWVEL